MNTATGVGNVRLAELQSGGTFQQRSCSALMSESSKLPPNIVNVSILLIRKNIGHITNEKTFMMCPTFLFVIFGEMIFTKFS